jgi:hypothetical protein
MRSYNYSDNKTISGYVGATNAQLQIKSVPTNRILKFPAFLTDFSQTFDATWNTEDVFGRMDPIATYQGTKRTMSLGFDLPAGALQEAKHNLEGCSELIKMVYPVYGSTISTNEFVGVGEENVARQVGFIGGNRILSDTIITEGAAGFREVLDTSNNGVLSKPPLVRIKFANLISGVDSSGLLGWMSGLSWKPNLEMGMFTTGEELFPKVISLSFSFNILHEQTLSQSPEIGSFPFGEIK